jgi:hypothetical protein
MDWIVAQNPFRSIHRASPFFESGSKINQLAQKKAQAYLFTDN